VARWGALLGTALLIVLALVAVMELRLALRGFHATVLDTEGRWLRERARAAELGGQALILVGGSRIQLDADLEVLRAQTGLEPVQLAIDGSSFLPVLEGLAADPAVRGTVIVDFSDHLLLPGAAPGVANEWQARYAAHGRLRRLPDFDTIETWLGERVRTPLRSYADGSRPITALTTRLLPARATPQYLTTFPDRSRQADYSKVSMPAFYYQRVLRNLGQEVPVAPGMTYGELEGELRRRIAAIQPMRDSLAAYEEAGRRLAAQAAAIRARGGRVHFVVLPKSGLVRMIDDRRTPRAMFWDRFAALAGAPVLHFEDVPALSGLQCPDGSHLDFRQRAGFTRDLVRALGLGA